MKFSDYLKTSSLNEGVLNEGVASAQTAKFAFAEFLKYKDVKNDTPIICINDKGKKIGDVYDMNVGVLENDGTFTELGYADKKLVKTNGTVIAIECK